MPTALLETRGAKTRELRRNVVIYFHDGDRVTVVAEEAARERLWALADLVFAPYAAYRRESGAGG